ncbi:MAG: CGNR zinc finger domain-containing protein, partial [Trebonia sp.]
CALALVNTRFLNAGQSVDLIAGPSRAAGWLTGRGLLPPGTAVNDLDADRLAALRETIRSLFTARAERRAPAAGDVPALNVALAAAPLVPTLNWGGTGPRRGEQLPAAAAEPVDVALARLAADALDLLTGTGEATAAPCGAHGCIRWFLRTHAARQWCSARCGDRVRAARHYARHHPAGASEN